MRPNPTNINLPQFHEVTWSGFQGELPTEAIEWLPQEEEGLQVAQACSTLSPWQWPTRPVFFIADAHADAEAFVASLIASGGVRLQQANPAGFELTPQGKAGTFVIGGDCLDKGPSNIQLLQRIRQLMDTGAEVKLLAGNHDMRLLMGLRMLSMTTHTGTEHLFIRMGPKVLPLLKEVFNHYLQDDLLADIPRLKICRQRLYPSDSWFDQFPRFAASLMPAKAIEKEVKRVRKRVASFEQDCAEIGLSLRQVYAAALKSQALFLQPGGEFSWFFDRMQLTHREGSFLFLHAGLDDHIVDILSQRGTDHLNDLYRTQINGDLFEFYFGPVANTIRTKYRDVDFPLTDRGVALANGHGLRAVVHGHQNRTAGQNIVLRQGMIHIEGDVTLDRNSRRKEGLPGHGIGVTIIHPSGQVIGISKDYPYAKVFEPQRYQ